MTLHDPAKMRLEGIEGRVVLVTGGASGIGAKVVETLSAMGAVVVASDLVEPAPPGAIGIGMDVTDESSVREAVAEIASEVGPIGVLVTCAGVLHMEPLESLTLDQWDEAMSVNLTGTFRAVQHVLPGMREAGWGRIVTMSSGAGLDGGDGQNIHYAATKGGVIAFTKGIATAYAAHGVTANAVAPRGIRTPMLAGIEVGPAPPVGRMGEPEDVAAAVAFLSSDHAGFITGEVLVINGGQW